MLGDAMEVEGTSRDKPKGFSKDVHDGFQGDDVEGISKKDNEEGKNGKDEPLRGVDKCFS